MPSSRSKRQLALDRLECGPWALTEEQVLAQFVPDLAASPDGLSQLAALAKSGRDLGTVLRLLNECAQDRIHTKEMRKGVKRSEHYQLDDVKRVSTRIEDAGELELEIWRAAPAALEDCPESLPQLELSLRELELAPLVESTGDLSPARSADLALPLPSSPFTRSPLVSPSASSSAPSFAASAAALTAATTTTTTTIASISAVVSSALADIWA